MENIKKEYKDPQVTFKLSHKGIELVPTIPIKKMKWVFKCNHVMGKEWKNLISYGSLKNLYEEYKRNCLMKNM